MMEITSEMGSWICQSKRNRTHYVFIMPSKTRPGEWYCIAYNGDVCCDDFWAKTLFDAFVRAQEILDAEL